VLLLGLPDLLGLDKSPAGLLAVPGAGDGGDDPACIVVRKGVHGAVHGAGIYLSNNASLSMTYSKPGANNWRVLAVYEVINNPEWKKTSDIYVIPDETALILQYIIVFNYEIEPDTLNNLNTLLNSDKLQIMADKKEQEMKKNTISLGLRRITIEYKQLMKTINNPSVELGFTVELPEGDGNIKLWNIKIFNVNNPKLQEQMKLLNIPCIILEIRFPEEYPFEPPFIRVLSPRFTLLTGHITSGGSICMEALSKQSWVPATTMESLIIQVKQALYEGGAIINESNIGVKYTLENAQIAFQRAVETHKHEWSN
jgi:ubiquitin-conjugating enzyme E2 Q